MTRIRVPQTTGRLQVVVGTKSSNVCHRHNRRDQIKAISAWDVEATYKQSTGTCPVPGCDSYGEQNKTPVTWVRHRSLYCLKCYKPSHITPLFSPTSHGVTLAQSGVLWLCGLCLKKTSFPHSSCKELWLPRALSTRGQESRAFVYICGIISASSTSLGDCEGVFSACQRPKKQFCCWQ